MLGSVEGRTGYNGSVSHSSILLSFLSLWIHYIILYLVLEITLRQFYKYLEVNCFIAFEYPFKGNHTGYHIEKAFYASSHNDTIIFCTCQYRSLAPQFLTSCSVKGYKQIQCNKIRGGLTIVSPCVEGLKVRPVEAC